MLDLKKLQGKATDLIEKMKAAQKLMKDKEEAKDEDGVKAGKAQYDTYVKEFDEVKKELEEAKEHQSRIEIQKEIEALAGKSEEGKPAVPSKATLEAKDKAKEENEKSGIFLDFVRGKALSGEARKALEPKSAILSAGEGAGSVVIPERMIMGMMGKSWCRAMGKAIPFLSTGATQGAPLIPEDFRPTLLMLPTEVPTVMDKVTIVPAPTGEVTWPALVQTQANTFGGVSFQWLGEGAEKPETEPVFEQLAIPTHELAGYTEVSERALSRSAIQLETFLTTLFRDAMRFVLDTVILTGTGTGQPTGIVNTAGILLQPRAVANQVSDVDLVKLKHQILPVHRAGAEWAIHDEVEEALELETDTQDRPLFRASTADGAFDRLVGFPFTVGTNLPTLGQQGDVIFGNFKHYIMAMEEEITLARSSEFKFRNNLIAFKIFSVVGGRLVEPLGMTILDDATS